MSRLSSAATATTTTKPTMMTDTHRVCSVGFIGRSPLASQPGPAALQPGDDDGGVLDGGAQRAERRGVADGALEPGVDLWSLVADLLAQQQDGSYQDDDDDQHDAADDVADGPVGSHRLHRFAEVADRLEVRVDRGQPGPHGGRELVHGLHPAGDGGERAADGPQVEDDPDEADR